LEESEDGRRWVNCEETDIGVINCKLAGQKMINGERYINGHGHMTEKVLGYSQWKWVDEMEVKTQS
jgi:hypothetical protein